MARDSLMDQLLRQKQRVGAWLSRHRRLLTFLASVIFAAGSVWSVRQLDISFEQLHATPLVLLFFVLAPVTLLYSGLGMLLLAHVTKVKMGFWHACRVSTWAQLAEALPLPGGAVVRAGSLVQAGGAAGRSTLLVLATAALWILLASIGAGAVLLAGGIPGGIFFLIAGLAGSCVILAWIARMGGLMIMVLTLLHRIAGMALAAVRVSAGFAALGVAMSIFDTMPFVLASIAGSAASIAPAGLGISEMLAVVMAKSVAVVPAAAFLAVALNRLVGLASTAVVAMFMQLLVRAPAADDGKIRLTPDP